jgi:hypothetical protein
VVFHNNRTGRHRSIYRNNSVHSPARHYIIFLHKAGSTAAIDVTRNLVKLHKGSPKICVDIVETPTQRGESFQSDKSKCNVIVDFARDKLATKFRDERVRADIASASSCQLMLQVRHPFDTLVSAFNSFTTDNHVYGSEKGTEAYKEEKEKRKRQHDLGLDRYVLKSYKRWEIKICRQLQNFQDAIDLGCQVQLTKYEDMIDSPMAWVSALKNFIHVNAEKGDEYVHQWAERQKKLVPNVSSHVAYLFPGMYKKMLKEKTIISLTRKVSPCMREHSGYFDGQ